MEGVGKTREGGGFRWTLHRRMGCMREELGRMKAGRIWKVFPGFRDVLGAFEKEGGRQANYGHGSRSSSTRKVLLYKAVTYNGNTNVAPGYLKSGTTYIRTCRVSPQSKYLPNSVLEGERVGGWAKGPVDGQSRNPTASVSSIQTPRPIAKRTAQVMCNKRDNCQKRLQKAARDFLYRNSQLEGRNGWRGRGRIKMTFPWNYKIGREPVGGTPRMVECGRGRERGN